MARTRLREQPTSTEPEVSLTPRWFSAPVETIGQVTEAGRLLYQELAAIEKQQTKQRYRSFVFSLLATGRAPASFSYSMSSAGSASAATFASDFRPPSLNQIAVVRDVLRERVWSRVSWLQIDPVVKSDFDLRERCLQASAWLDSFFESNGLEQDISSVGDEATIYGTGCYKIVPSRDKQRVETVRVLWDDLRISLDADLAKPTLVGAVAFENRETLIRAYAAEDKELAQAILRQPPACRGFNASKTIQDVVALCEGWHWYTAANGDDKGRHVLALSDGTTLVDEEWTLGCPFIFLRYTTSPKSFPGIGVPERCLGLQLELDRMCAARADFQRSMSRPHAQVERSSQVSDPQADIVEYTGTPVRYDVISGTPKDLSVDIGALEAKILAREGISQVANGDVPDSLTAAVALEASVRIADQRLRSHAVNLEEFIEAVGTQLLKVAAVVKPKTRVGDRDVNWSEVAIDLKRARLRAFKLSLLPSDQSKRLELIERWSQAGLLTQAQRMRLLEMPETQGTPPPQSGSENLADKLVTEILKTGKYVPPDELCDPDVQYQHARARYLAEAAGGLEESKLVLLLQFIEAAKALVPPAPVAPPSPPQS